MKYLSPRNALLGVLGATAALAAVTLARADDCCATASCPATTTSADSASAGMTVAKDLTTGQLRAPTPEEMAALQAATAGKKNAGFRPEPVVRQLPNGTLAITIDPSFDLSTVATKGPDGKVQITCVPGEQVEAALKAAQEGGLTKKEILDEK